MNLAELQLQLDVVNAQLSLMAAQERSQNAMHARNLARTQALKAQLVAKIAELEAAPPVEEPQA